MLTYQFLWAFSIKYLSTFLILWFDCNIYIPHIYAYVLVFDVLLD